VESDSDGKWFEQMRARAVGLFTRGVAMGTADVIPGVSGGTMALITGIYDELVGTVAGIDRHLLAALLRGRFTEVLERANVGFLVPLLAGIFTAIVTLAKGITWLLETHPIPVWGALSGLIVASLLVVTRQVDSWNLRTGLMTLLGLVVGYTVTLLVPVQTGVEWYKFTGPGGGERERSVHHRSLRHWIRDGDSWLFPCSALAVGSRPRIDDGLPCGPDGRFHSQGMALPSRT
jgi:hypothetical protein